MNETVLVRVFSHNDQHLRDLSLDRNELVYLSPGKKTGKTMGGLRQGN